MQGKLALWEASELSCNLASDTIIHQTAAHDVQERALWCLTHISGSPTCNIGESKMLLHVT